MDEPESRSWDGQHSTLTTGAAKGPHIAIISSMTLIETERRPFVPGTTGWTARDLDDPVIEREWFRGSYEIIDGVLTTMPPAYFSGGEAIVNLIDVLRPYFRKQGMRGGFSIEVDIIIDELRVARADAVMLNADDKRRQREAAARAGKTDIRRTRIYVPPTLVIESISPGHEDHDEKTKRKWYAEFGVPNYWLLNVFERTLRCLRLGTRGYRMDVQGTSGSISPSAFPGLVIPLEDVWET